MYHYRAQLQQPRYARSETEETTSLASTSSPMSSFRALYYVQSPARESQDGGDTDHILPYSGNIAGSPLPSGSHVAGLDADAAAATPSSRSLAASSSASSSRRILPISSSSPLSGINKASHKKINRKASSGKDWAASNVILEESELGAGPNSPSHLTRYTSVLLVLFACIVFLVLFILFFSIICKPAHPHVSIRNVVFRNFYMGQGLDASGVPTKLVSLNCTVMIDFYNPSKYFAVHIHPVQAILSYSQLQIATGQIAKYSQAKGLRRLIDVVVHATKVPIYGASDNLSQVYISKQGMPFTLVTSLHSQYYVVGKLVKPKYLIQVTCNIVVDSKTMALLTPLRTSCTYIS